MGKIVRMGNPFGFGFADCERYITLFRNSVRADYLNVLAPSPQNREERVQSRKVLEDHVAELMRRTGKDDIFEIMTADVLEPWGFYFLPMVGPNINLPRSCLIGVIGGPEDIMPDGYHRIIIETEDKQCPGIEWFENYDTHDDVVNGNSKPRIWCQKNATRKQYYVIRKHMLPSVGKTSSTKD